jgi:hypothetical protein
VTIGKILVSLWAVLALAGPAAAERAARMASPSPDAPPEASQFEFLVGQWEIVAEPRVEGLAARVHGNPKLPGTWAAWPALDGWGIEDELRITDPSGNPQLLSHAVRAYDPKAERWSISTLDVYRSLFNTLTAEWRDNRMAVSGDGTDAQGKSYRTRSFFRDITPNSFVYQVDRSYDGGDTWTEAFLKIEAKRVAAVAPRSRD